MNDKKLKNKKRDVRGRSPERILKEWRENVKAGKCSRYVMPYNVKVDLALAAQYPADVKTIRFITKNKHDRMELIRVRNPVQWAMEMTGTK